MAFSRFANRFCEGGDRDEASVAETITPCGDARGRSRGVEIRLVDREIDLYDARRARGATFDGEPALTSHYTGDDVEEDDRDSRRWVGRYGMCGMDDAGGRGGGSSGFIG